MTHLIKRRSLPALHLPLYPAQALRSEPESASRQDVRDFFVAYFSGLIVFGLMLV